MDSFKEEIIRLIPQLRRYAFALVNHADFADDLVQDSLERALSRQHLWDPSRPMKPWLLTLLHNLHANKARQFNQSPALVSISDMGDIPDFQHSAEMPVSDLQKALDHLSTEHREIILLVGLEQMSYKETATILSIPIGTVMSRLLRARKNLKHILDGHSQATSQRSE